MHLDQISQLQVENLRPGVEAETGMSFSGTRFSRLQDAVGRVLHRQATHELDQVLANPKERGLFLERLACELTVGETFFFRNEFHFRALRDHVLPQILRDNWEKREVRLWSAGCASGEEPYSLAILLDQLLRDQHDWRVSILGSDLNPQYLVRAREACYRAWSFRQTKIHEDRTYFLQAGDTFQLVPRLREQVRFAYLNLVKDVYPSPLTGTFGLDLVLFRNVAIYLKPELTKKIIERFYRALRPGGWLLLGEIEVSLAPTDGFEPVRFEQATFHRKVCGGNASPTKPPPAMPPLAEFAAEPPSRRGITTLSIPPPRASQAVPTLPDWVPLPTRRVAGPAVAESAFEQAERLLAEGKLEDAEDAVERIADKNQRVTSRLRLAQLFLARASIARARQMLDRCLADEPLMIAAQLLQASFAEEAGDLEKAERAYRRALYVDRNCPMAHFHLALVLQQKNDLAGARRSAKTMLKLIESKDPHELVEYGEGICFGRLKEMASMILDV